MKKILGAFLLVACATVGVPSQALAKHPKTPPTNQTPHNLKVQKLITQRIHRAFQLAGRRDSFVIQCHLVPPTQASSLKSAARAYFESTGQDVSDFDREYAIGFQEGIIMFRTKSPKQQELLCARLADV